MSDNMINEEMSPAEILAEEQAFESSFNAERGIEEPAPAAEPPKVEEPAPAAEPPKVEEPVPAAEPPKVEEPTPTPARQPISIGGLNEEQIAQALSRIGTMQSAIDKMAGRNGQLMQQIEQLRNNPPQTVAQQRALDIKLTRLSEGFPELARLLQEDLQASVPVPTVAAPGAPAEQVLTPDAIEAKLAERLAPLREEMEVKVLTVAHPDWMNVIRTPEFALFRDNVLPAGEGSKLMESEDSTYIAGKLTEFKQWRAAVTAPVTAPVTPPAPSPQSRRLAGAVLPNGTPASPAPAVEMTEEDGFLSGFNAERKRTGR